MVWYENNKNQNEEDFFLPLKLKNNIPSHHEKKNAKLHIYIYKTFAKDHSSFIIYTESFWSGKL